MARASGSGLMPICCPSCPTSRTSRARIRSLIRGSLLAGGVAIAKSSSCRRSYLLCAGWVVVERRRRPTGQRERCGGGVSTRRTLVWPGGGEPRFPMQLWRRRVPAMPGTATTRSAWSMSLWTPDGERPVGPDDDSAAGTDGARGALAGGPVPRGPGPARAMQAELDEVRAQLLAAPAAVVDRQPRHGDLRAGRHPPHRARAEAAEASLAIDALAALVEGLEGRLGEPEPTLREALGQLRDGLPRGVRGPQG